MNKKSVLWILLDLIFLIVFNVVFFVTSGFEHPASVWISYVFIHFAYIMVVVTPFLIRKGSSAAVFGFSLYSISSAYFLTEFVAGILFIILKNDSYKMPLIVQVVIAGIYAILLISNLIANESTADSVEKHEVEVNYIKEAALQIKGLVGKASDKKTNKAIEKAYDAIHASPTKSSGSVKNLENAIVGQISSLRNAVNAGNKDDIIAISDKIVSLVDERNRILRTM